MKRFLLLAAGFVWSVCSSSGFSAEPDKGPLNFETHVRPILKANCFECHGEGKKLKSGLDLRLKHYLIKGGKSGSALVPGKPADSAVLQRVRSQEMPPGKKKLTKEEMAILERWIQEGAATAQPEPKELPLGFSISPVEASHWAFQAIRRVEAPQVKAASLVRNPIDRFLLARLETKGLSFSVEADKITLIRRATFDLLGLPPTPAEVDEFLKDSASDAYEKLIDRLLASPHYGERWGRHWLDVAGYADSEGGSASDAERKSSYRYRDYVIRSFNADKPFDQFVIEQLAGDELLPPPYDKIAPAELDKLIATGFLRMAPDGTGAADVDAKVARIATSARGRHAADRFGFAPGSDAALRPVPQSSLRSDTAGRLLPCPRRVRAGPGCEELARPGGPRDRPVQGRGSQEGRRDREGSRQDRSATREKAGAVHRSARSKSSSPSCRRRDTRNRESRRPATPRLRSERPRSRSCCKRIRASMSAPDRSIFTTARPPRT